MTYQPVQTPVRGQKAGAVTRRAMLAGAPLAVAAVVLPSGTAHAAASGAECLADLLAPR